MSIRTVSPLQFAESSRGEKIDLIDVRTPAEYRAIHAEPARNVPLDQLDPETLARLRGGHGDRPVYLICPSGTRGRQACEKFEAAGFPEVVNVEGGTEAWAEGGLPVVRDQGVMPLARQVRIAEGLLVLLGALLGWLVYPAFGGLAALVGAGLIFAGVTDTCGMGMLLALMPWNRAKGDAPPAEVGTSNPPERKDPV